MPVEGFQKHSGARLTICAEEQESFWDYLRTVDFMSGESSLYWTDRQGNWSHKGFVLRNESIHVQKIEIPQGVKAIFHLNLEPFSEYGEHEWERMSLPSEVLWRTQGEADSILFEGFYDQTISQEGYVAAVWITGQSKCMVTEDGTLTAEASEELMIYSTIRHFEKFGPGCAGKLWRKPLRQLKKEYHLKESHLRLSIKSCWMKTGQYMAG